MMTKQSLLFSLEKTFDLSIYVEQMASTFEDLGCSKSKHYKDTYALNVFEFIDGLTSKDRETINSSTNKDCVTKFIII